MLNFKQWLLNEDDIRTGAKMGLYPSLVDSLGAYPPLYITPHAADFITYFGLEYDKKPLKSLKPGLIDPKDTCRGDDKFKFKYHVP